MRKTQMRSNRWRLAAVVATVVAVAAALAGCAPGRSAAAGEEVTEQSLRQGQIDVASLSGVLRDKALERGAIRPLFTDHELLGSFTAGSYVFRINFIKRNPGTVREVVIARFEEILRKRARNADGSPLKYWKSPGVAGKGGFIAEKEFGNWIDRLTREGELKGRQVNAADLYTNEFNPFRDGGDAK